MSAFECLIAAAIPLAIIYGIGGSAVSGAVSAAELPLAAIFWLATKQMRLQRKWAHTERHQELQEAAEQGVSVETLRQRRQAGL
jgi:hypothetical protein